MHWSAGARARIAQPKTVTLAAQAMGEAARHVLRWQAGSDKICEVAE